MQYVENSSNVAKYVHIWYCQNTFSRLSITSFLLDSKTRKKNYYAFRNDFQKSLNKLVIKRLKSNLKVKLYCEQSGLCLVSNAPMGEKQLSSRSSKLHVHHLVSRSTTNEIKLDKKLYEARRNKILLHENCHLALHKNKVFQSSSLLRTSVPKKPIIY